MNFATMIRTFAVFGSMFAGIQPAALGQQGPFILGGDDFSSHGWYSVDFSAGSGNSVTETEFNDLPSVADPITIGDDFVATISSYGENDMVKFTCAAGQELYAYTSLLGLKDTVIKLFATDGVTLLAKNDDCGLGKIAALESCLYYRFNSAGSYFLKIEPYDASVDLGGYVLHLRAAFNLSIGGGGIYVQRALEAIASGVTSNHDGTVAVLGTYQSDGQSAPAATLYQLVVPIAAHTTSLNGTVLFYEHESIQQFFDDLAAGLVKPAIIVVPGWNNFDGVDAADGAILTANGSLIAQHVASGGGLLAHGGSESDPAHAYGWIGSLLPGAFVTGSPGNHAMLLTHEGEFDLPGVTTADMREGTFHNTFANHGVQVLSRAPAPVGSAVSVNEVESNNTFATANSLSIGNAWKSSIAPPGDVDFASFAATAGQVVFASTDLTSLPDSTLTLYGTDGTTVLAFNDDCAIGTYSSCLSAQIPTTGTYFLKVASYHPSDSGSYSLVWLDQTANPVDVIIGSVKTNPWAYLGHPLAGTQGEPLLTGTGSFVAGTPLTISLRKAKPGGLAYLIFGAGTLNVPLYGGLLVPVPSFVLPLPTDTNGELTLATTTPPGLPAGVVINFQYWIDDAAGPQGVAASNAMSGKTP